MSNRVHRSTFRAIAIVAALCVALPVIAQTAELENEARVMARLELRLAEEREVDDLEDEANDLAVREYLAVLTRSTNPVDRRAVAAIAQGNVSGGVTILEQRARARDTQMAANDAAARLTRAEDWKQVGAAAFLDNTERAISAYENARRFAPQDATVLDQLAWLYGRQAREADRRVAAQQLTMLQEPESRVRGLIHLADIHLDQTDGRGARPYVDQALALATEHNLLKQRAMLLSFLAGCQMLERDFRDAERSAASAVELSRANGFRFEEATGLFIQGTIHFGRGAGSLFGRQGHMRRAEESYEQVQAIFEDQGDEIALAQILIRRGHVSRLMDDLPLSEQRLRRALEILTRLGVRARFGFAQHQLATTLAEQGNYAEAIPLFRSAVQLARETDQTIYEAGALYDWASAESRRHNRPEACRLARESEAAFRRAPGQGGQAAAVGMLASLWCG
jgi:tetratricopeptide (TPR) repeat protein